MVCVKCNNDRNFWSEMTLISFPAERESMGSTQDSNQPTGWRVKRPVCYQCLGWKRLDPKY